jgi:thiol-disulfide isomerase/thioredoxin
MRFLFSLLIGLVTNFCVIAQKANVSIIGEINGSYPDKIFLFFNGNFSAKDSLSTKISNGKFQFNLTTKLPILCRLHFGQNTNVVEFYIDSPKTSIFLSSKIEKKDGLNSERVKFQLDSIFGSVIESTKISMGKWTEQLENSSFSNLERKRLYFKCLDDFISNNGKNILSLYFLSNNQILSLEQIIFLNNKIDKSIINSYEEEKVLRKITSLVQVQNRVIGNSFNNVDLPDSLGQLIRTSIYNGKFVLINFWASWCAPCREKHPQLINFYKEYKRNQFEIIGISFDSDLTDWKKALNIDKVGWLQLVDTSYTNGNISKFYDITSVPANILLDGNQKILGFDLNLSEIKNLIDNKR